MLPDPLLVVECGFQIEPGERAAGRLLDSDDPPTAVFAFNDNIAIGVLRAARRRGVRVPEDLSVVGFDDSEMAALVTLTSVVTPVLRFRS